MCVVDTFLDTVSPGPMMVYALTLSVTTVLGDRSSSLCCVANVLIQFIAALQFVKQTP